MTSQNFSHRGSTNTEPGAVATGFMAGSLIMNQFSAINIEREASDPVATAPGSVFVDSRCESLAARIV